MYSTHCNVKKQLFLHKTDQLFSFFLLNLL